ncbi:MAG: DUF308 domain-containing protein [Pseudomonadota bacterium]|nr:DUF308 domain-containing protein [Pseudomonadota bacterium]
MTDSTQSSYSPRPGLLSAAGVAIIVLGAGAAALPFLDRNSANQLIGILLVAAGLIEMLAALLRDQTRFLALVAGAVTTLAGVLFLLDTGARFLPIITIVTAWLLIRGLILAVTTALAHGSVRRWIAISAATDVALGLLLFVGLSISTLIVTLFGPTPEMVASFAWVLAVSFVVTGMLLLEIASCERDAASDG